MLVAKLRVGIVLGLLTVAGSPGVRSRVSINVSVYDDAGLGAKEVSSTAFGGAGVHWLNCSVNGETECKQGQIPGQPCN